jgi:hypothetical protein
MSSLQQNWRRGQKWLYLEAREVGGRRRGLREGGRDGPNNVSTYE